jgi:ATP phosphoribosyltransferase regulatory subunit HisZ
MTSHPIPSGTRDVLPDEMRELRAIEAALRATFERLDYGEISTPPSRPTACSTSRATCWCCART